MRNLRLRISLAAACAAFVMLAMAACNFNVTTAHISRVKITSDQGLAHEATEFGVKDSIYGVVTVANVPGKVTVTTQLFAEKVSGQPDNFHIEALDKSYDMTSDADVTYSLSAPTAGWPTGMYRLECKMLVDGVQKDQKNVSFSVKGD